MAARALSLMLDRSCRLAARDACIQAARSRRSVHDVGVAQPRRSTMIRHFHRLVGAALLLAGLTAAYAAENDELLKRLDKDGNGKISLNEASEHDALFVAFKDLDKDRDGELTKEELANFKGGN
jgi:hypothetical protein